jgi:hypothetical protein
MDDPNIEKRAATGIAVNLSSYLITGSLAVLGAQAVVVTFTLDKKENLIAFGVVSFLAFVSLIGSIYFGGKGIDELTKSGYRGEWAITTRGGRFNSQAILTLVGVLLLGISTLLGSPKDATAEKRLQVAIDSQRDAIAQIGQKLQVLEQSQTADHLLVEQFMKEHVTKSVGGSRTRRRARKTGH